MPPRRRNAFGSGPGASGREGWLTHDGKPATVTGTGVVPPLAERLGPALPEAAPRFASSNRRTAADDPGGPAVECPPAGPGDVRPAPLAEADRPACGSMMERRHPEGWRRAPGGQPRHWTECGTHGRPGGPGFVPASRRPGPRDAFVGRSARARTADMGPVPNNRRLPIRSTVRVHGPASPAPRPGAERVAGDREVLTEVRPVLTYTPVGPGRAGTACRAAGRKRCPGLASGRRSGIRRSVWTPPLRPNRRGVLREEPERGDGGGVDALARGAGAGAVPGPDGTEGGL